MLFLSAIVFFIGYLLGSLPFGYFAGQLNGLDIREHGSRNVGATNVLRVVGKPWGIGVFIADALKGFVAVRVALYLASRNPAGAAYLEFFAILAAAACVVGHSYPVWLSFKGGKGVATSVGSLLGIMPIAAATIFLVWLAVFLLTRYVSLASILAACALPLVVAALIHWHLTRGMVLLYFSIAMTVLVVWRHRSNLVRLANGTEHRFDRK
ncbi:MAG: glycerol-3-phosphate 1-O-acyltransferase PlsY [Chthoniobacterales bacterium]